MARTCPQCGAKAIDEESQFCNQCGTPFAEDRPKKVIVRTVPRLADVSPPPEQPRPSPQTVVEPPVAEIRVPAVPPARSLADPPRVRPPAQQPARQPRRPAPVPPFKKLLLKEYFKPVYWIGVIAILLIVISGISTGTSKPATTPDTTTNTTAGGSSGDLLASIPLFWIGILVFGNLLWRGVCEMGAVQFALYNSHISTCNDRNTGHDFSADDQIPEYHEGESGDFVNCPRCGKVVAASELRACEHCGVQGCSSCIRMMGLIKKTLTCKDCYDRK
jgi:hypothetical protein